MPAVSLPICAPTPQIVELFAALRTAVDSRERELLVELDDRVVATREVLRPRPPTPTRLHMRTLAHTSTVYVAPPAPQARRRRGARHIRAGTFATSAPGLQASETQRSVVEALSVSFGACAAYAGCVARLPS
jgi:hypothetical protein